MNEAASQIDLVLLLQEILSPRKVLDFGELAAFFHRLSQLRPLLESEPVVPANERGQALLKSKSLFLERFPIWVLEFGPSAQSLLA